MLGQRGVKRGANMSDPVWVTYAEAAERLGISVEGVRLKVKRDQKLGKDAKLRVRRDNSGPELTNCARLTHKRTNEEHWLIGGRRKTHDSRQGLGSMPLMAQRHLENCAINPVGLASCAEIGNLRFFDRGRNIDFNPIGKIWAFR